MYKNINDEFIDEYRNDPRAKDNFFIKVQQEIEVKPPSKFSNFGDGPQFYNKPKEDKKTNSSDLKTHSNFGSGPQYISKPADDTAYISQNKKVSIQEKSMIAPIERKMSMTMKTFDSERKVSYYGEFDAFDISE